MAADSATLHLLKLLLQALDRRVRALQVLIQTITLTDELLLPLSEPMLLDLDLLREPLSQRLFLLLELRVVQLAGSRLAELASLHLLGAVGFVVRFLSGVDEIQHVGSDENRAQLLEVAVVFILDFCYAPAVLTALHDAAVGCLDILLGTNHGEWHGSHKGAGVLGSGLVVLLNRGCVYLDALGLNDGTDLLIY